MWAGLALGVVILSASTRLCNLGTFSLWLDEILLVGRARGSVAAAWLASAANAEHPPLTAVLMSIGYGAGLDDTAQRLLPIVAGILTVLLLAAWVTRHLGRRAGIIAGVLAALSPLHVRYSQELRPYSYLLLFVMLTLLAIDRLRRRPDWGNALRLALVACAGLYTHLQYPLVVVPAGIMLLCSGERSPERSDATRHSALRWAGAAIAVALIAYLPWLRVLFTLAHRPAAGGALTWSWAEAAKRWQFLTVATRDGDAFGWGGALMLALVVLGVIVTAHKAIGVASLAAVVVGTVGVEALLQAKGHWSNGRYDLFVWPFLIVFAAAGLAWLSASRRRAVVALPVALAVVWAHVAGLAEYQRIGRPSWDRLAKAVELVRRPGEPVLTENLQCWIGLGYYLHTLGDDGASSAAPALSNLGGDAAALRSLVQRDGSCLLITGRLPASAELRKIAAESPKLAEYWSTAALHRVRTDRPWPSNGSWPTPDISLLPQALRGQPRDCLSRAFRVVAGEPAIPTTCRLDFDATSTRGRLLSGWSSFEKSADGATFVWATGHEATVEVALASGSPSCLSVRLWPMVCAQSTQRARFLLDGREIGRLDLPRGARTIHLPIPECGTRGGDSLLVAQFQHVCSPRENDARSQDARPLAAAFDWLEITPGTCSTGGTP